MQLFKGYVAECEGDNQRARFMSLSRSSFSRSWRFRGTLWILVVAGSSSSLDPRRRWILVVAGSSSSLDPRGQAENRPGL
jgi:hypothetical protein